ncbi:hypothetical protein HYH02_001526 [Chlamydomonas schloesseri]|uniref:Uncharacterized protein n=1 Tax=Chlamydomonas schloesseri TaxID=2026947 RepID=A0A835WVM2_9CHLO|nr:hypothetical protein HYH02_001526 [Chlamydomonas schloesseri]|eukprot:KAG2453300.1 hypothetical protein HYH02_001526 [Chlamydomonas schloesseri]
MGPFLGSRGLALVALGPLACSAFSVDLGGLTPEGSSAEAQRIALAVLVLGCVLGALSFILIFLSVLEYAGRLFLTRCFNYGVAHGVLAFLWLGEIGLAAYLLASTSPSAPVLPAIAFVAGGAVLAAAHAGLILVATCWCCCGGAFVGSPADLNPKSALLTPQQGAGGGHHHRGAGGAAGSGAGAGGAHPLAHGDGGSSSGPFRATYGLLPGSNAYAYQIFIPGTDEEQAAFGAYASLPTPTGQARNAPSGQLPQRTPARGGAGEAGGGSRKGHSVQPFAPQTGQQSGQQLGPMRQ